jgi:hypothetical protein
MQIAIGNFVGSPVFIKTNEYYLVSLYEARVTADGGYYEGISCLRNKLQGWSIKTNYSTRITMDGGYYEALSCAEKGLQQLSIL